MPCPNGDIIQIPFGLFFYSQLKFRFDYEAN